MMHRPTDMQSVQGPESGATPLTVAQMTFDVSSSVMLLFNFWNVNSPAGMILSVFVVFLLTVFYEVLKVWRVSLGNGFQPDPPPEPADASSCSCSEASLAPTETPLNPDPGRTRKSWVLHLVQALLHVLQVTLGYMLMLCVMSYNTWIFLGVIAGSGLGYFVSFPLVQRLGVLARVKP
ncbi:protein SLC31A2 [Austrofundulus limnaeus]|uniref:Copper transport protein n=1 Tax=Austrofundulus limnaeus TaxID=52670 RepID=A0A2I4CJW1_AUSLI|nr:PREDICTED: probable low affinity copper uptake protein 2 [Austrofundulus limnaeus]